MTSTDAPAIDMTSTIDRRVRAIRASEAALANPIMPDTVIRTIPSRGPRPSPRRRCIR